MNIAPKPDFNPKLDDIPVKEYQKVSMLMPLLAGFCLGVVSVGLALAIVAAL